MRNIVRSQVAVLLFLALTSVAATANDQHEAAVTPEHHAMSTFDSVVENYLVIQVALAGDTLDGIKAGAKSIAESAATLNLHFDVAKAGVKASASESMHAVLPSLEKSALVLENAGSLKEARAAFGDLSDVMIEYRGLVDGVVPNIAYCGMAKKSWLQNGDTIANPYYGSSMLRCGSIVSN